MVLARDAADGGVEILLVQRAKELRFMGGMYVFPGGAVHAEDAEAAIRGRIVGGAIAWPRGDGESESAAPPGYAGRGSRRGGRGRGRRADEDVHVHGDEDEDAHVHVHENEDEDGDEDEDEQQGFARAYALAGIRETCEEAGILLGVREAGHEHAAIARRLLLEGASLSQALEAIDARVDLGALVPLARWITPAISPIRFDTRFYVARAPLNQDASADGTESTSLIWRTPSRAIAEHRARTIVLSPPTRSTLADIAELSSVTQLLEFAASRRAPCFE